MTRRSTGQADSASAVGLPAGNDPRVIEWILQALEGLRYGALEIVVHDARIVHIERREKLRPETDRRC